MAGFAVADGLARLVKRSIQLRDALSADIDIIAQWLDNEPDHSWTSEKLLSLIDHPSYCLRVVENVVENPAEGEGAFNLDLTPEDLPAFYLCHWVADQCTLMYIAVAEQKRGCGLACVLMEDLLYKANLRGCAEVLLEVRESNRPAIKLYQKFQFALAGRRPGYYPAQRNDQPGSKPHTSETALLYTLQLIAQR